MTEHDSTPTFNLEEIFPGLPAEEEGPVYVGTHTTTNGDRLTVEAYRGTQAIGRSSGNPLDMTEYGRVRFTLHNAASDSETTVVLSQEDDTEAVLALLGRGHKVADSRDRANDRTANYPRL